MVHETRGKVVGGSAMISEIADWGDKKRNTFPTSNLACIIKKYPGSKNFAIFKNFLEVGNYS